LSAGTAERAGGRGHVEPGRSVGGGRGRATDSMTRTAGGRGPGQARNAPNTPWKDSDAKKFLRDELMSSRDHMFWKPETKAAHILKEYPIFQPYEKNFATNFRNLKQSIRDMHQNQNEVPQSSLTGKQPNEPKNEKNIASSEQKQSKDPKPSRPKNSFFKSPWQNCDAKRFLRDGLMSSDHNELWAMTSDDMVRKYSIFEPHKDDFATKLNIIKNSVRGNVDQKDFPWAHSDAKLFLRDELMSSRDHKFWKPETKAAQILKEYPIFQPYEKNFATNFKNLKDVIEGNLYQIEFDTKAVDKHLRNFPRSTHNNRGNLLWHIHPARALLIADIAAGRHVGRTPLQLKSDRVEYKDFGTEQWCKIVHAEISRQRADVFWQAKRNRKENKRHLKRSENNELARL
jgi:hypothetical protein